MTNLATFALILITWSSPEGMEAEIVDHGLSYDDCAVALAALGTPALEHGMMFTCEPEGETL